MRAALVLSLVWFTACGGAGDGLVFVETLQPGAVRLVEGSNSTSKILPLDDGSTIVAGRAPSGSADFVDPSGGEATTTMTGERFLLCYDADGTLLWHQTQPGSNDLRWLDIEASPDGTILALGVTTDPVQFGPFTVALHDTYPITYFVLRMNRSGVPQSITSHIHTEEPNGGDPAGALEVDPRDGSYVILVQTGSRFRIEPTTGVVAAEIVNKTIAKYDAAGTLEWRTFGTFIGFGFMSMLADGDVMVGADFPKDGFFRDGFAEDTSALVRLNGETGQLRSSIQFGGFLRMEGFVECADGFAVSGTQRTALTVGEQTIPEAEGGLLLRIGGDNTLAWYRAVGDGVFLSHLARDPDDGDLVACGGFRGVFADRDPGERQDGLIAKYGDATGARLWTRTFSGPEWLTVSQVWYAPNGDLGVSGEANGPNTIALPNGELSFDAADVLYMFRLR